MTALDKPPREKLDSTSVELKLCPEKLGFGRNG